MKKIFTLMVAALLLFSVGATAQSTRWNGGKTKTQLQPQAAKQMPLAGAARQSTYWNRGENKAQLQPKQAVNQSIDEQRAVKQYAKVHASFPAYTELNYYTVIPTDGTPVTGSFTAQNNSIDLWGDIIAGKGYSFAVQAGKGYTITCTYEASQAVLFEEALYLLTGGTLEGNYNDIIGSNGNDGYASQITVTYFYMATADENIRLLLADYSQNDLDYTITIKEIPSYAELDYSTVIPTDETPVTGSFTFADNSVALPWKGVTGTGYSFAVQAGKGYKITCSFDISQDDLLNAHLVLLTDGTLTGDIDDDEIGHNGKYIYGSQTTLTYSYGAFADGNIRLLLFDYDSHDVNYTITIEESNTVPYTALDYSTLIPTDNTPVTGSFTFANNSVTISWNNLTVTGTGYSFAVQAGKGYKITCNFDISQDDWLNAYLALLTGGTLTGNPDDEIDHNNKSTYNSQTTLTYTYEALADGTIRLLLFEGYLNDVNYTITIEELNVVSYTALNYSTLIPTDNTPVTGSFTKADNMVVDCWNGILTGKGCSFAAQAGKGYQITTSFFAPQAVQFNAGFDLLTGGVFQGNGNDYINGSGNSTHASEMTVTLDYVATADGTIRILLSDYELNDLVYTIQIKEYTLPVPLITLPELLGNTTNTITYTAGMQFTDCGTTTDLVIGDAVNFGLDWTANLTFYATAYKITLAAGDAIQISADKEWDSYLYLYQADGTGGYILIDENDWSSYGGNADSYLDFTATNAGDYYIVVTDYHPNTAGRYYLSVWNTADEPANSFTLSTVITLPELLDNTTKVITYAAGMQYTDHGTTTDLVAGDASNFGFRRDGENFYAAAYKITLAAGDAIQISANKEWDSYLYLYLADGAGGYSLIDENDWSDYGGNADSYLDFTVTDGGDYYIVVTDYSSNHSDRYYLNVWNTIDEPENDYATIISAINTGSNSITVAEAATEDDIRMELMKLIITGTTDSDPVTILSNPFLWNISGNTATYLPISAPQGYAYDNNLQAISITINYLTGINDTQANPAIIYALGKNIVVKNAEAGTRLFVADMMGRMIIATTVKDNETTVPVNNTGIYVVRVGAQAAKVLCR